MNARSTVHWVAGFAFLFAIILTPILLDSVSGILDLTLLQMVTVAMILTNLVALGVFSLAIWMSPDEDEGREGSYRPYVEPDYRTRREDMDRSPSRARTSALIAGIDPERKEFVFE